MNWWETVTGWWSVQAAGVRWFLGIEFAIMCGLFAAVPLVPRKRPAAAGYGPGLGARLAEIAALMGKPLLPWQRAVVDRLFDDEPPADEHRGADAGWSPAGATAAAGASPDMSDDALALRSELRRGVEAEVEGRETVIAADVESEALDADLMGLRLDATLVDLNRRLDGNLQEFAGRVAAIVDRWFPPDRIEEATPAAADRPAIGRRARRDRKRQRQGKTPIGGTVQA